MKCLIIRSDGLLSMPDAEKWSLVFSNMMRDNEVVVLPVNFHIEAIIDDDENSTVTM